MLVKGPQEITVWSFLRSGLVTMKEQPNIKSWHAMGALKWLKLKLHCVHCIGDTAVLHKALDFIWRGKYSCISYMLSCEYQVVRNRYSRLLFTSEDRFCANLCMPEHSTNMMSQCQYPTFVWCHWSTVVSDITKLSQKRPSLVTMAKSAIDNCF